MLHKLHFKNLFCSNSLSFEKGILRWVFIMIVICSLFFSCDYFSNKSTKSEDFDTLKSNLPRETNPQLETGELQELVKGNTQFACDLYRQIRGGKDNIFISPHSISVALAMTYAGARGNTEKQMAEVLHFTLSQERLHNAFNALDLELAKRPQAVEKDGFKLHICNAAWGQKDYSFLQSYLDVLAVNYGSGLQLLDFMSDPEQCRITINNWVAEQTEDRIKDLLPPGSLSALTRLVLTNAIYFKAGWLYPFDEDLTSDAPFFTLDDQEITVSMMGQMGTFGYTAEKGYYQAVEILYKGEEVSMVILLPAPGRFEEFEASLSVVFINNIIERITLQGLDLHMPKFSFKWKDSLVEILSSMGMTDAFIGGVADFSGIDGSYRLSIMDIFHQSFIAVNEAGTEAAAATAVVIGETSLPDSMTINRPFIFLIRDRITGAILFLGRVLNPAG